MSNRSLWAPAGDSFDRIRSLRTSYLRARLSSRELIDLSVGSPDVGPTEYWRGRLCRYIQDETLHGYGLFADEANVRLRSSFLKYYERRFLAKNQHGIMNADSNVVELLGTKEGIVHCMGALLRDGGSVLLPNPGYTVYETAARSVGADIIRIPHDSSGQLCLSALEPRQVVDCRMLVLCSPNNPTGVVASPETIEQALQFSADHDIILVIDRAYAEVRNEWKRRGNLCDIGLLSGKDAICRVVELHSLSKSVGIAGWRVGFAIGSDEVIGAIRAIKNIADFGIFPPFQYVAAEMLDDLELISERTSAVYRDRMDKFTRTLAAAGWHIPIPEAGFFLWARLSDIYPKGDVAFVEELLGEAGVLLSPGSGFGPAGHGYVRIAVVQPQSVLDDAASRICVWLNRRKPRRDELPRAKTDAPQNFS